MEKTTKGLIGLGALAGIAYLAVKGNKDEEQSFGTGGFGGFGGGDAGLAGEAGGDGSASPAGMTFNFPSPDTSRLATFLGDTPQTQPEQQLITKKAALSTASVSAPLTTEATKNTVNDSILKIAPMTLKAGSTKTAIAGSNLSEPAKVDLMGYTGSPGNVVNEQQKRVNEALGINLLSQKGNQISEYTQAEKTRSKSQANIFAKVVGAVISPAVEQPRAITAGQNIIAPVYENIVSDKKSWQGGTVKSGSGGFGSENVKVIPSGGSQAVTEALQTTKKEASSQAAAKITEAGYGQTLFSPTKSSSSSSSSSSKSSAVVKKSAAEPAKKTWTLAEVKSGKNRR